MFYVLISTIFLNFKPICTPSKEETSFDIVDNPWPVQYWSGCTTTLHHASSHLGIGLPDSHLHSKNRPDVSWCIIHIIRLFWSFLAWFGFVVHSRLRSRLNSRSTRVGFLRAEQCRTGGGFGEFLIVFDSIGWSSSPLFALYPNGRWASNLFQTCEFPVNRPFDPLLPLTTGDLLPKTNVRPCLGWLPSGSHFRCYCHLLHF